MKSRAIALALLACVFCTVGFGVFYLMRGSSSAVGEAKVARDGGLISSVVASTSSVASAVSPAVAGRQLPTVRGTLPYVVTAARPIDRQLRNELESFGARTVAFLDSNRMVVEAAPAIVTRLRADSRLSSVDERLPESKVEAELAAMISNGAETVDATVVALSSVDLETVIAQVKEAGGEILTGCLNGEDSLTARLPASVVADLARRGDVQWLESYERPHLFNDIAVNANTMNVRSQWKSDENPAGLSGAGQIVTTSDSGIDTGDLTTMHKDLCDQIVGIKVYGSCYKYDENGHGTHTAGSIVGDGTQSDGKIRGTAWGAKLYAWFCGGKGGSVYTPSAAELFRPDQGNYPAYIHSASWGSSTSGKYTDQCRSIDNDIWKHPDFLPVFAAGNDGDSGSQTVASPASAKNVLTVGATQNARSGYDGGWGNGNPKKTATFSSRGPCADGRIKPDVASPGVGILSTRAHGKDYSYGIYDEYYAYDSGTSMATPLTAGAVALVREWLLRRDEFSEDAAKRPTAALMKAVIMGGATDASKPNNDQGWGRVNIGETLCPSNRAIKLVDRIPFAPSSNFVWVVETTNTAPLSVQLAWIDYPASAGASKTLINDLDLTVYSVPNGELKTWYGNGGTSSDHKNNVESVRIASAEPTKYIISVDCTTVPYDYTDGGAAALYVSGAFDPAANPTAPGIVRIRERDQGYLSLDNAVAEVRSGETIEILQPVQLQKSVTVPASCSIVATNDNPHASIVTVVKGAALAIPDGVTLSMSNVVFSAGATTPVSVAANGILRVGGTVDIDVDEGAVGVAMAKAGGFRIFAPLTAGFPLSCDGAKGIGETFGSVENAMDLDTAKKSAVLIANADDETGEIRGGVVENDGVMNLVWAEAEVPVEESVGYFVGADGVTNTSGRLDRLFEKYSRAEPTLAAGRIVIRQSASLSSNSIFGKDVAIVGELGSDGTYPKISVDSTAAGFTPTNGAFTLCNLAFAGHSGAPFITAKGESCTIEHCSFSDFLGKTGTSGAFTISNGVATVRGCLFENCRTQTGKNGFGGAVSLMTAGSSLSLEDTTITNCYATTYGGGVYAAGKTSVSIAGQLLVRDNESDNYKLSKGMQDNIFLGKTNVALNVAKALSGGTGSVGLRILSGNKEGYVFAALSDELDAGAIVVSAQSIVNDAYGNLEAQDWNGEGSHLVWAVHVENREVDVSEAIVDIRLSSEGAGVHHYFATMADAFEKVNEAGGTVTLLCDCDVVDDVTLTNDVTLTSADGGPFTLVRANSCAITVASGVTLRLADVKVSSSIDLEAFNVVHAFFCIDGGALDLDAGAALTGLVGNASRAAGAVVVYNGGEFTMRDGASIVGCGNAYANVADATGYGAVTVDDGVARLLGGEISSGSSHVYGGGLFAGSGSIVEISGDATVYGSVNASGRACNLTVADKSSLRLDGALTGKIGVTRAYGAPTDVFGSVTADLQYDTLTNSAAQFGNDETDAYGVAVTNAENTATLLVWSTAIAADGSVTLTIDSQPTTFWCVGDIPEQKPKAQPLPIAFSAIANAGASETYTVTVTAAVAKCWYSLYETNSLTGGFKTDGVAPVDRKQATEDGKIEFTRPRTNGSLFWKVIAEPEQ